MTFRQRYFLVLSVGFMVIGTVIVVRALISGVAPAGIFGAVLIALGVVRLRDLLRFVRGTMTHDS